MEPNRRVKTFKNGSYYGIWLKTVRHAEKSSFLSKLSGTLALIGRKMPCFSTMIIIFRQVPIFAAQIHNQRTWTF